MTVAEISDMALSKADILAVAVRVAPFVAHPVYVSANPASLSNLTSNLIGKAGWVARQSHGLIR
jgi:hypothetical protein